MSISGGYTYKVIADHEYDGGGVAGDHGDHTADIGWRLLRPECLRPDLEHGSAMHGHLKMDTDDIADAITDVRHRVDD